LPCHLNKKEIPIPFFLDGIGEEAGEREAFRNKNKERDIESKRDLL